jgi:hypothetical protein
LGPTGFGVVIKNSEGEIINIIAGNMGFDTSNSTDL